MLLKTVTKTESTIEIQTPAYFKCKWGTGVAMLSEKGLTKANSKLIVFYEPHEYCFDDTVKEAMEGEPATAEEYSEAFEKALESIQQFQTV